MKVNKTKYETKAELVNKMSKYIGWGDSNFKTKMNEFLYDYDIDSKYIFEGDKRYRRLKLNKEYSGLFYILAKAYRKDIFIKDKQFSFRDNPWKDIESYYEEIIKGIDEELNDEQRYDIMNSYPYIAMICELKGIRKINEKLMELKTALGMVNSSIRTDVLEDIYCCIDTLILQVYNKKILAEEEDKKQLLELVRESKDIISMRKALPDNKDKTYEEILTDFDLIKIKKFEQIIKEREKYGYIGEYLLDKLKYEMENNDYPTHSKTRTEIKQEKEAKKDKINEYYTFKNQTNEVLKRIMHLNDEEIMKFHSDRKLLLMKELDEHIEQIKNKYNNFETMESISKDIIGYMDSKDHEKLQEYGPQLESRSYYEGYLKFVEEIRKFNNNSNKKKDKKISK